MDPKATIPSTEVPAGFLRRSKDFGSDFIFGSATSAFQVEGASRKDGRGPCIWDIFAADEKRNLFLPYGEDAVLHYEHYAKDVDIMKDIGFDAYRFSISWSRILPSGKKESRNQEGINFYKKLLNKLKEKKIEPFVTLLHFDVPQALEKEYDGFLNRKIADDFRDYADICFREFGKEVKYWITINEPWSFAYGAYVKDFLAPGRGKVQENLLRRSNNTIDDLEDDGSIDPPSRYSFPTSIRKRSIAKPSERRISDKEDELKNAYIVTHNQLLAHGMAAKLYKDKYQRVQNGKIGITLVSQWFEPLTDDKKDTDAARRALDFMLGWFLHPLIHGKYPETMVKYVKEGHLPVDELVKDKSIIQDSCDFIGMNYYTARYIRHDERNGGNYVEDQRVKYHVKRKDKFIGEDKGAAGWLYSYPRGIMDLLLYIKKEYNNPLIYITENGIDDPDDKSLKLKESIYDHKRLRYFHDHLAFVRDAKRQGANVQGFFAWSLLDNFEWGFGFTSRFGITYVDYKNEARERTLKHSAIWLKFFLEN
ncbi:hypothetical protein ACH5RR_015028 [Cinchona calisaya]|uniref:Beta-glucosidase n=1 Tax=Cinchona calisaya TaxID=153742 RepID=A0ABD2ZS10_9GENT